MLVDTVLRLKGSSVVTASPETPIGEIARLLHDARIGAVVISADDKTPDGILSERDIVAAIATEGSSALDHKASELMTCEVITCEPGDGVAGLMDVMTQNRIRHLPVMANGALCGMMSIGDVVKCHVDEIEHEAEALRAYVSQ